MDHNIDIFILVFQFETLLNSLWKVVAACQFVYEEKFIRKYNIPALKVVGFEGRVVIWSWIKNEA